MRVDIKDVEVSESFHEISPCDYGDCKKPSPYIIWPDSLFPGNTYACNEHVNHLWAGRRHLGVHFSIGYKISAIQQRLNEYKLMEAKR
jgi:hypothetical protein